MNTVQGLELQKRMRELEKESNKSNQTEDKSMRRVRHAERGRELVRESGRWETDSVTLNKVPPRVMSRMADVYEDTLGKEMPRDDDEVFDAFLSRYTGADFHRKFWNVTFMDGTAVAYTNNPGINVVEVFDESGAVAGVETYL